MLDFTSALYLGLRHPVASLRPWNQLTTGRPAALEPPPGAATIARQLAELQGCELGILIPSTLHLFWDLFGILAREQVSIFMDAGTYAITRWGVERAAALGVPVRSFPHHDAAALHRELQKNMRHGARPLVVTDGLCPGCGEVAPLQDYVQSIRPFGGRLVLDDTQALGILGNPSESGVPYGEGGGGSLRWSNLQCPDVLVGNSLAKGFGVPVAVLAGSEAMIRSVIAKSETRSHTSPPSIAAIHAAEHALAMNNKCGDSLRLRLAGLVQRFRRRLGEIGLATFGNLFPMQTLAPIPGINAMKLHRHLLQFGVRTVLRKGRRSGNPRLSFIITASHRPSEIDWAVRALEKSVRNNLILKGAKP
jgi:8-amino-7-oxononanoate synthase